MEIYRTQEGSETWDELGNVTSCEVKYYVVDPDDKQTAMEEVFAAAPLAIGTAERSSIRFDGFTGDRVAEITVSYSSDDDSGGGSDDGDSDDPAVNFDCSSGSKRVTQAISQECVYAGSGETKDSSSAAAAVPIGWNGKTGAESEASGVDVSIGELRETYTKSMSRSSVTSTSWKRNVAELVGKVNSGSFKGWSAGEVMFLGCSYSAPLKGSSKVSVSFHFQIRMNESSAKVAGNNVGSVDGYEYLWAITDDQVVDGERQRKIRKVYKATVCESASFSSLGL